MTDFDIITTVNKNMDFEKTIAENHSLRSNNEVLVLIAISAIVIVASLYIYVINEQQKDQKKYTMAMF